jgi:hypothetical protein
VVGIDAADGFQGRSQDVPIQPDELTSIARRLEATSVESIKSIAVIPSICFKKFYLFVY